MRRQAIAPGGERGRRALVGGPAPRGSVRRRSGRRPAELYHAIDWGYVGLMVAVAVTVFVLVRFALERTA